MRLELNGCILVKEIQIHGFYQYDVDAGILRIEIRYA